MVEVIVNLKKQIKAQVKNVRDKGICITTHEPLEMGKFLTLEISLPGREKLKIKGKVMWSLDLGSKFYENGIDFFYINKNYTEMLVEYLN